MNQGRNFAASMSLIVLAGVLSFVFTLAFVVMNERPMVASNFMKTREQIITSMCVTWRHDYWMEKSKSGFGSGMTQDERDALWDQMAQVFDNDIVPNMQFKKSE